MDAGADDYLTKPFNAERVACAVRADADPGLTGGIVLAREA